MSGNTFGKIFRITTFGESHGTAMGCILDGCPPQIDLTKEDIQYELNRRKPGQSDVTTQRKKMMRLRYYQVSLKEKLLELL